MALKLKPIAVLACGVILGFSFSAHATPKTDCERGLQEAEAAIAERVADPKARETIKRVFASAQDAQKEGKYQKCITVTNSIKEQVKTK